jgi:predicted DNA-binding transcriptional regulator AlpA
VAEKTLLTQQEAAERLGMSPRWMEVRRYQGGGPPFVRVSSRCVRYRPEDLEAWTADRVRISTSDRRGDGD